MSDDSKAPPFFGSDAPSRATSRSPEAERLDTAEERMRQALGLSSGSSAQTIARPQPDRQLLARQKSPDAHSAHRRHRFVQDGQVPVVHVNRRVEGAADPAAQVSRIQSLESALQSERTGRERAERLAHAAQLAVGDLRAKLHGAEQAATEAQAQSQRRATECAELRQRDTRQRDRIAELEAALAEAEQKAAQAIVALAEEKLARIADQAASGQTHVAAPKPLKRVLRADKKRLAAEAGSEPEPEPVKWWLTSKAG